MRQKSDQLCSKRAFSMVEVVVAAVIFAAGAAGIFATIRYTSTFQSSDRRTRAAICAKSYLDWLNTQVSSSTWAATFSTGAVHTIVNPANPAVCSSFTVKYTVTDVSGARKVDLNVDL